jgi:hypothetical protein
MPLIPQELPLLALLVDVVGERGGHLLSVELI